MKLETDNFQSWAGTWHRRRFPTATCEHVLLKAGEELGEVMSAWNSLAGFSGHGGTFEDFISECADVVIALFVAVDRWTEGSLMQAIEVKLQILSTPGAHRASRL